MSRSNRYCPSDRNMCVPISFDFVPQVLILSYGQSNDYDKGIAVLLNGVSKHIEHLLSYNYYFELSISWNGKTVTYYGNATGDLGTGKAEPYNPQAQYNAAGVVYRYAAIG